jgi:hypothetical protein
MTVLEVEQGAPVGDKAQEMMNMVHYTMRYILKDGADLSREMTDLAIEILDRVVVEPDAGPLALMSAYHMLAMIHQYRGEEELHEAAVARSAEIAIAVEQGIIEEVNTAYG